MDALRATLDSTDGQVATVSRTSSPPPLDLLSPPPVVAEYWCHTQVRVTKMKYVWTISNFSFCREEMGEVVKSSFFSCGPNDKLKWCLRINPKGLDEESREYLSLYLLLVNCGTKSEARAKFKFSILNAKREETKAMESQRPTDLCKAKIGALKTNGLLPNDRLTILCEVSVVGETLSESGQVNNQPITVPECNLHEDIGSLLFKQLLTDVTLVVISSNPSNGKCSSDCSLSHVHQNPCVLGHTLPGLNSVSEQATKFSTYESTGEEDDEDEDDQDELDEGEEFDDEEDEDDDDGDGEQQENESEREEDTQSSYRESHLTFLVEDGSHLASNGSNSNAEQGEAEAAATATHRTSIIGDNHASSTSSPNLAHNPTHVMSSSTLTPATTTNVPTKGIIIPLTSATPSPLLVPCTGGAVDALSMKQQYSGDNSNNSASNSDWRLTSSSSCVTAQGSINRDDREVKSNVTCDASQRTSDSNWCSKNGSHRSRTSSSVPSTSCALPSTTDSSSSSCSKGRQSAVHNADVGSSSTTTSSTTIITSKEKPEDTEESVEAETSGTSSRVRRSTRRKTIHRLPQPQIVLAASTTSSHSNPAAATPSSSTVCPINVTNQTVKCSSTGSTSNSSTVSGTSNSSVVLRQFEAHKAILAARSPVFAAMFGHGMEESRANRVEITDMEPDTVAEILRYIYTGQVVGMDRLAHELLAAADKYQLERLKTMCEEALVESLSVENACDIFGLADMHNAEQLKVHTLEFIMLHAHDVCETEGYEQLVRHRPRLLNECFRSLASQQLPLRCWARKRPRQS
ncbi:unnamed protein product [Heterobilharzia americana]|nr:unnamed protein product [Heterobilharzia americana]